MVVIILMTLNVYVKTVLGTRIKFIIIKKTTCDLIPVYLLLPEPKSALEITECNLPET